MSEATKLSDLPLVTSLGSSDTIIATDPNGAAKRIAPDKVHPDKNKATITIPESVSAGWVRIAESSSTDGVMLTIYHSWYNLAPVPTVLILSLCPAHFSANSKSSVKVINVGNYTTKLRVVYPDGGNTKYSSYVEIYIPDTSNNKFFVNIANNRSTDLLSQYQAGSIPEGYTAKEFDITKTAWGGVKRCAPISCNSLPSEGQKGGHHEQGDKHQRRSYTLLVKGGNIQRIAQRDNDRCPGSERVDSERQQRRRDYQTRNIHCCFRNKYTRSSNWGIQVWQPVRGKGECLPLPNIPSGRRKRLSTKDVHWRRMAALVPSRDRHSSLIATRGKEVVVI